LRPVSKSNLDKLHAELFLQPGDVVFDVGGNVGRTSEIYVEHGAGNVHVFEPEPALASDLSKTFSDNEKVTVHAYGLGINDGYYRFFVSEENSGSHTLSRSFAEALDEAHGHVKPREEVLVRIRPLDSLDLDRMDYLKIDTEGSEFDVLEGARETLKTRPPRFVQVECFPVPNFGRFRSTISFLVNHFKYVWAPTVTSCGLYEANDAKNCFSKPGFLDTWLQDGNPLICASNTGPAELVKHPHPYITVVV
tara:strand:- start:267 stop:1016 length:750 start_codon:yes stop_codon:yes gene_type:complete